jgi:FkbM family methyltransferase
MLSNLGLRVMAKALVKTGLCRFIVIDRQDYKVRFHPSSFSAGFWVHPEYGRQDEAFLRRYLTRDDLVVDIGANIGSLALCAAGRANRVIAIEAHPRTFAFLKSNVELNGYKNMELHNVAMGHEPGKLCFSDLDDDDQNHVSQRGLEVPVQTLDSFKVGKVGLLKVDVEGYEKFVFQGARETLRRTACVFFESFEPQYARYGSSLAEVIAPLQDAGFVLYRLRGEGIEPLPRAYASAVCENLLAIRDLKDFITRTQYSITAHSA